MPQTAVATTGRFASTATILAIAGGLALYQMTSLVLGPSGSRQLSLSLAIPAIDVDELSQPLISNVNLVLGSLSAPAVPAVASPAPVHRPAMPPKVGAGPSQAPTTAVTSPVMAPTPRPVAAPTTDLPAHPLPGVRPTPPGEPTLDGSGD